jgi:hypothetical protein
MGPHAEDVRENLLCSGIPVSLIWLVLPLDTCKARALQRYKKIPYPFPWAAVKYSVPLIQDEIGFSWEYIWSRESHFHTMRLEFSGLLPSMRCTHHLGDYFKSKRIFLANHGCSRISSRDCEDPFGKHPGNRMSILGLIQKGYAGRNPITVYRRDLCRKLKHGNNTVMRDAGVWKRCWDSRSRIKNASSERS